MLNFLLLNHLLLDFFFPETFKGNIKSISATMKLKELLDVLY